MGRRRPVRQQPGLDVRELQGILPRVLNQSPTASDCLFCEAGSRMPPDICNAYSVPYPAMDTNTGGGEKGRGIRKSRSSDQFLFGNTDETKNQQFIIRRSSC
mmetsp:Transcript_10035/g.21030  ORF Transcript_10035/g.21030 Transcript_10035/m.21030 type:complete len:102 (+) Transcript_10035:283-588(+)